MLSLAALMGLELEGNAWKVLCSSSCIVDMTEKMKVYETYLPLGHISEWMEELSGF